MIALSARKNNKEPITFRYHRVMGVIGQRPLPMDHLRSWPQPETNVPAVKAELDKRLEAGSFVDRLSAFQLAFSVTPQNELPELVNDYLSTKIPELAGGVVFSVECDHALYLSQISVCRTLIRESAFPGIGSKATTDPTLLEGGMGILSIDSVGGASYLLPAVSAVSPTQLGVVAHRGGGSLVVLLPKPTRSPDSRAPLSIADLHQPHYFTYPRLGLTVIGRAQAGDSVVFMSWWIDMWNRVLGQLLDPASHRDDRGMFDPYLMLGRVVTLERLLACVQSILINSGLEELTRMELFFEAIDLLEGLGGKIGSWHDLTSPSFAERQLKKLKSELVRHPEVERVVLERCQRGVDALISLRNGFRDDVRRTRVVDVDNGVFDVLRAIRNAGHGLRGAGDDRSNVALKRMMGHLSRVPADLPELVWFHLLRMLCFAQWN
jgi:hypothetical protein